MTDRDRAGLARNRFGILDWVKLGLIVGVCCLGGEVATAEDCLDCHEEMAASLEGTTHDHNAVMCGDCHRGGEQHSEDPSVDNISVPARDDAAGIIATCTNCHQPHLELDKVGFDPHQTEGMSCISCHSVHSQTTRLLLDNGGDFCGKCHTGIDRQFARRSSHPLAEEILTCWSCHDFTGASPDLGHGRSETCLKCHPDQAGPFLHEHEATSSFSADGEGCVACHSPHGSSTEQLLKQPGNGLCRQCHGVPVRHAVAHNGRWADVDCMVCHTQVHGSYDGPNLLDPMLGTKMGDGPGGCFCHNVEN